MAGPKKFGTFGGVFTPSILTILGVIMYLRLGWVVGSAGLLTLIGVIVLSHVISVSTGLSVSSIATDKKVGAGGVYYVLSRSLGLPIGGALGLALFVATAFSISLYMVGFAEIFNEYIDFGQITTESKEVISDTNALRITGSIGLLILTIIAFISTSVALKTQFFILAAIVLSLISIFLGDPSKVTVASDLIQDIKNSDSAAFPLIFAIFFPAVTGFTAGVAMSGDLKDPKKSIPVGTMGAIAVGLIVYFGLALFLYYSFEPEVLIAESKVMFIMAAVPLLVYIGVWGATLSSALGGILGGPRILQAMSIDKITPKVFAKGVGKDNEPRNALILTVLIAEAGILIGDLNVIAEVVSMFYLAAYGFINIAFFLESWASADFKPNFRVPKWIGLIGFLSTFAIMSQLNMMAMIAAFLIIGGIYYYLSRKQISLGTGDIWQSVWSTIVKRGLKRMEAGEDHKRNWKPNLLLFSGDSEYRSNMIEFSKSISGQYGIVTNFDLEENPEAKVLFPRNKQSVNDEELEKYGIFGRHLEVQNRFKGIESIACTFGFSGIEPNTVLMAWPGETNDRIWFTEMTKKLMELDYNVLYLDYDKRWGFRKREKIDLWWRGIGDNAELMLMLAKFIGQSPDWSQANIRVLMVNDANVNYKIIETRILKVLELFRVNAEIKIINNEIDQKPLYELMKIYSQESDLVLVGIPEIDSGETASFVEKTNELVSTIGTTLLVKASSLFQEADLAFEKINVRSLELEEVNDIPAFNPNEFEGKLVDALQEYDEKIGLLFKDLVQQGIDPIQAFHHDLMVRLTKEIEKALEESQQFVSNQERLNFISNKLMAINELYNNRIHSQLNDVFKHLQDALQSFMSEREDLYQNVPHRLKNRHYLGGNGEVIKGSHTVRYRNSLHRIWLSKGIEDIYLCLLDFGYRSLLTVHQSKNILHKAVWNLLDEENLEDSITSEINVLDGALAEIDQEVLNLGQAFYNEIVLRQRNEINKTLDLLMQKNYQAAIDKEYTILSNKAIYEVRKNINSFSGDLYRNTILFTYHLEADIYLLSFALEVNEIIEELTSQWKNEVEQKLTLEVDETIHHIVEIEKLIEEKESKSLSTYQIQFGVEQHFNLTNELNQISKTGLKKIQHLPELVELINANSLNQIREVQNEEAVETQEIQLRDIGEYIFQVKFMEPLTDGIQTYENQLRRYYSAMLSGKNALQKALNEFVLTADYDKLQHAVTGVKESVGHAKEDLEACFKAIFGELKENKSRIRQELDINQIIEQNDIIESHIRKSKARKGVLQGVNKSVEVLGNAYSKAQEYVTARKKERSSLDFVRKHSHLISEQDVICSFIENVSAGSYVPYLYQQIFSEGYFLNEEAFASRENEIKLIEKGIERIKRGTKGAILILGASKSGKTALTDFAIKKFLQHKPFHISLGNVFNKTGNGLNEAFQRATSSEGTVRQILDKCTPGSVFVLNDIEEWALKGKDKFQTIDQLVAIINDFGSEHFFVLNANIHAYRVLKERTKINQGIVATVILPAMNNAEIIELVKKRHEDSGLYLTYDGNSEQFVKETTLKKWYQSILAGANGNIGKALQMWISKIQEKEENNLVFEKGQNYDFPYIRDAELQNLIYHLFIFKSITKKELIDIYGKEYDLWITRWLDAFINIGFLELNKNGSFSIIGNARIYVENWLNELGYLR